MRTKNDASAKRTQIATVRLPVISNPHGIPTFKDFMAQAERDFEVEMNAKNEAYSFILSHGLFLEFEQFCKETRGMDHHANTVSSLGLRITGLQ